MEGKKQLRRGKRELHLWCWDGFLYDSSRSGICKIKMSDLFSCFTALNQDNCEVLWLRLHDTLKILYACYVLVISNLFQQAT